MEESIADMLTTKGSTRETTKVRSGLKFEGATACEVLHDSANEAARWSGSNSINDSTTSTLSLLMWCVSIAAVFVTRVISKDEADYRDIFIMNTAYRVGARFVENLNRAFRRENNLVEASDKMTRFMDALSKAEEVKSFKPGYRVIYFNADCSRWGPNHMTHFFYAVMFILLLKHLHLLGLVEWVLRQAERKQVQNPMRLVEYLATRDHANKNEAIRKFVEYT